MSLSRTALDTPELEGSHAVEVSDLPNSGQHVSFPQLATKVAAPVKVAADLAVGDDTTDVVLWLLHSTSPDELQRVKRLKALDKSPSGARSPVARRISGKSSATAITPSNSGPASPLTKKEEKWVDTVTQADCTPLQPFKTTYKYLPAELGLFRGNLVRGLRANSLNGPKPVDNITKRPSSAKSMKTSYAPTPAEMGIEDIQLPRRLTAVKQMLEEKARKDRRAERATKLTPKPVDPACGDQWVRDVRQNAASGKNVEASGLGIGDLSDWYKSLSPQPQATGVEQADSVLQSPSQESLVQDIPQDQDLEMESSQMVIDRDDLDAILDSIAQTMPLKLPADAEVEGDIHQDNHGVENQGSDDEPLHVAVSDLDARPLTIDTNAKDDGDGDTLGRTMHSPSRRRRWTSDSENEGNAAQRGLPDSSSGQLGSPLFGLASNRNKNTAMGRRRSQERSRSPGPVPSKLTWKRQVDISMALAALQNVPQALSDFPATSKVAVVGTSVCDIDLLYLDDLEVLIESLAVFHKLVNDLAKDMEGQILQAKVDNMLIAFQSPDQAVQFCCKLQEDLVKFPSWPEKLKDIPYCRTIVQDNAKVFAGLPVSCILDHGELQVKRQGTDEQQFYGTVFDRIHGFQASRKSTRGEILIFNEVIEDLEDTKALVDLSKQEEYHSAIPLSLIGRKAVLSEPDSLGPEPTSKPPLRKSRTPTGAQASASPRSGAQLSAGQKRPEGEGDSQEEVSNVPTAVCPPMSPVFTVKRPASPAFPPMDSDAPLPCAKSAEFIEADMVFVYSNVWGAGSLWGRNGEVMWHALNLHHELLHELVLELGGCILDVEGSQFMLGFQDPIDAVEFALCFQLELLDLDWPEDLLALPEAAPVPTDDDEGYVFRGLRTRCVLHAVPGLDFRNAEIVNLQSKLAESMQEIAHKGNQGQILLTDIIRELAWEEEPGFDIPHVVRTVRRQHLWGLKEDCMIYELVPDCLEKRSTLWPTDENRRSSIIPSTSFEHVQAPTGELVMVFTDIQGSTRMWELDAESMFEALQMHNNLMRCLLRKHNGYEVKTEGDAFMVTFASPDNAVRFCVQAQEQLLMIDWPEPIVQSPDGCEVYTEEPVQGSLPDTTGNPYRKVNGMSSADVLDIDKFGWVPVIKDGKQLLFRGPRVRMGIHLGSPQCIEDILTGRMDYFGRAVNKAARVGSHAKGGEIVISDVVHEKIISDIAELGHPQVVDLGPANLKGLDEPVVMFQVLPKGLNQRDFCREPDIHPPSPPMVANDSELMQDKEQLMSRLLNMEFRVKAADDDRQSQLNEALKIIGENRVYTTDTMQKFMAASTTRSIESISLDMAKYLHYQLHWIDELHRVMVSSSVPFLSMVASSLTSKVASRRTSTATPCTRLSIGRGSKTPRTPSIFSGTPTLHNLRRQTFQTLRPRPRSRAGTVTSRRGSTSKFMETPKRAEESTTTVPTSSTPAPMRKAGRRARAATVQERKTHHLELFRKDRKLSVCVHFEEAKPIDPSPSTPESVGLVDMCNTSPRRTPSKSSPRLDSDCEESSPARQATDVHIKALEGSYKLGLSKYRMTQEIVSPVLTDSTKFDSFSSMPTGVTTPTVNFGSFSPGTTNLATPTSSGNILTPSILKSNASFSHCDHSPKGPQMAETTTGIIAIGLKHKTSQPHTPRRSPPTRRPASPPRAPIRQDSGSSTAVLADQHSPITQSPTKLSSFLKKEASSTMSNESADTLPIRMRPAPLGEILFDSSPTRLPEVHDSWDVFGDLSNHGGTSSTPKRLSGTDPVQGKFREHFGNTITAFLNRLVETTEPGGRAEILEEEQANRTTLQNKARILILELRLRNADQRDCQHLFELESSSRECLVMAQDGERDRLAIAYQFEVLQIVVNLPFRERQDVEQITEPSARTAFLQMEKYDRRSIYQQSWKERREIEIAEAPEQLMRPFDRKIAYIYRTHRRVSQPLDVKCPFVRAEDCPFQKKSSIHGLCPVHAARATVLEDEMDKLLGDQFC